MNRLLLLFVMGFVCGLQGFAQQNLALSAVAAHSGGGSTSAGFGPDNYNDGIIPAGTAQPWGWVSSNGWIEYTWSSPETFQDIVFYKGGRNATSGIVEVWDASASSYVTVLNLSGVLTSALYDSISLPTPVTSTRLRFNNLAGAGNPNFREIKVYQAATGNNDAGVISTNPVPEVCPGSYPVDVTIRNFGLNLIDSVEVHWEMDGVSQPVYLHTSTLDTAGGMGNVTASVTLGSFNFQPSQTYTLKAWTALPNGVADTINLNDTLETQVALGAPTGVSVSNLSSTTVDVSWTSLAGTTYGLIYGPQGFNPSSGGTTVVPASSPYTITGLTPTTVYDVYVFADCGGGIFSENSVPANFATLISGPSGVNCPANNPVTLFTEEFNDVTAGWTGDIGSGNSNGMWNINSGTTTSTGTGPNGAHSGSNYMYFEASGAGPASLFSPAIDLSPATDSAELAFWMHAYGADMGYLVIRVSTTSASGPFNDTVFFYNQGELQSSNGDPWQHVGVRLDQYVGQTIWLELEADRNSGFTSDFAIDLLTVETCGDICIPPSSLSAGNFSPGTADLDWTENSGATSWDIEFGSAGFTPTGTPTNAGITSKPFQVTGLQPTTAYEFYVRSDCGGTTGQSAWAGPFIFTTPIAAPNGVNCPSNNPVPLLTEEFNDVSSGWTGDIGSGNTNGMWNINSGGTTSGSTGPSGAHSGSNYIYFEASGAGPASLFSPVIDLSQATDQAELAFWLHAYGANTGYLVIRASTTSASGPFNDTVFLYNQGELQASNTDPYQHVGVSLDQYLGQTIWLEFEADRNGGFTSDIAIDLLTVETCGDICIPPTGLSASNFVADSADLGWTENSGATNWDIELGTVGFSPTGTPTHAGVTSNPVRVGNLLPNTGYEFYVRSNCGAPSGTSAWVGPFAFNTPLQAPQGVTCPNNDQSVILSEEFDDNSGSIWTGDIGTFTGMWIFGNSASANTGPSSAHSGSGYVHFDASGAGPASLISPQINLVPATDGAELSFWMHAYGDNVGYLVIRASTAGPNGPFNDTVLLYNSGQLQTSGTDPWQPVGVDLSNYLGQSLWLEFEADRAGTITGDIALDLLKVTTCGSYCLPEIFTLDSIVVNSAYDATVFIDTSSDNFQLEWGPCGYSQGTGTFMSGSSPFNISNLTPSTCYDVYVRRNCGAGNGFSGWGGPFKFATPCISYCDFKANLYDSFGDGWNGAEISFYQNSVPVATLGSSFTTGTQVLDIPVQLCDSVPTYVILTDGGSFPTEIGFDITSPYPQMVGSHSASSVSTGDTLAVFNASCALPTCVWPNSLGATTFGPDSAQLFWSPHDSIGLGFEVSFGADISTPSAGTTVIVSDTTYTATNLTQGENYCYFVRSICTPGDTSLWEGPYCFIAPCPTLQAPLVETFEGFTLGWFQGPQNCWTLENSANLTSATSGYSWDLRNTSQTTSGTTTGPDRDNTLAPATGGKFFNADVSHGTTGAWAALVTPVVDISNLSNPELEYHLHRYGTIMADFYVDIFDGTQWVMGVHSYTNQTGMQTSQADPYTDTIIDLSPYIGTTNFQARFRTVSNGCCAGDNAIDDIRISDPPSCPDPYNLSASSVTADSATLTWRPGTFGNTDFEISYGAGLSSAHLGTKVQVNDSTHILSGLSSSTNYCYYVREICAVGDTSFWSGPYCFTTACVALQAPFTQDFENFTVGYYQGMENCWTLENTSNLASATSGYSWDLRNTSQTTSGTTTGPDRDNTLAPAMGGKFFNADVSFGTSGDSAMLISPIVDISNLNNPELVYHLHRYGTAMADFYVDVYDGAQWINGVQSFTNPTGAQTSQADPYQEVRLNLAPYVGTTNLQVRFRTVSNGCCAGDNAIDDISIVEGPTCPDPWNLDFARTSATSGDLSWQGPATATSYLIEHGSAGFALGTGTSATSTSASAAISGIPQGNLVYEAYVRAICGPGDTSGWAGPVTLSPEPCDDMEVYPTGTLGNQSSLILPWAGAGGDAEISTAQANSGTQSLHIHDSGPNAFSDVVAVFDSSYTSGVHNVEFAFYIPSGDGGYYNILHDYAGGSNVWAIEVYLDAAGTATVDMGTNATGTIGTYNFNVGAWNHVEHIIDLDSDTAWIEVNGSATNVGWQWSLGSSNMGDRFNAVNFYSAANAGQTPNVYFDDLCVSPYVPASCPAPTNLGAVNLAGNSADLSWTTGGASSWVIEYGPSGFSKGTGTTVANVTTNPYTLGGLSANTGYCFYVRDVCSPGDSSAWAGPYCFTTAVSCPAPTGLTAVNITTTGADLEWRPGTFGNVDFEVSLGANISTPGAGTSVIVADSSHAATGLSSAANYCYFVREICAPGDTSAWAGPYCFTTGSTGTPCQPVTNVAAGNVECDNLEVTWTSNTNSSIMEYGPTGFTPGQGTPTGTVTSPYTITGLIAGTDYDVYIADICTGDTSAFSGPLTVTTDTVPKPVAVITMGTDSVTATGFFQDLTASASTGAISYSWDFGNGGTATGDSVQAVYSANGTYTVILTATNACGTDTAMATVVATGIGLGENALGRSLSVYPNPTQGDVTVEFAAQGGSNATLRVMDSRGGEVKRADYNNVNGLFRESISLEGMARGIYMIEITSGDMRAYRRVNLQ